MKKKWLALLLALTTVLGLVFLGTTLNASANSIVRVTSDSATIYNGVDGTATRTLPINSAWQYDQRVQGNGGAWWYRVSTNEWVKDTNVSESTQSAKNATGVVTVKSGKTATVRASLNGRPTGQTLSSGTAWKYSQTAVDAWGVTWYHVSSDGWVENIDVSEGQGQSQGRNGVLSAARQYIGVPYVWGGKTPAGFDCSGFVAYVFKQAGYGSKLPTAYTGNLYNDAINNFGAYKVSQSQAQPGDLVFFGNYPYDHVGIITGNGTMIDAQNRGVVDNDLLRYFKGTVTILHLNY